MSQSAPGLIPIFGSEGQLRLLGRSSFTRTGTLAELQQTTGITQQTVSREVNRLLDAGLLHGRRLGRLHLVKPSRASPYFPELSGLLLKALGPRSVLGERLAGVDGIEDAYIFGSWARRYEGEPGAPPGDIDVVIIGEPNVDAVYDSTSSAGRPANALG